MATLGVAAQGSLTINGIVKDNTGEPLIGVNVTEKGTTNGTITDFDGKYVLTISGRNSVLAFSYIGYVTQEVAVGNNTTINITLQDDTKALSEVVVVGYGTQRREEVTSAITKITSENFVKGPVVSPSQLIQGKVAGLAITSVNGDPFGNPTIVLRGIATLESSVEPLIVIDGVPGGSLGSLQPEDVESIDVLKDGSAAAIYGTRGTGGVIIVTTKNGKGAQRNTVEYNGWFGFDTMYGTPDLLNASEWRAYMAEQKAAGYPNRFAESMQDYGHDTDWYDAISRTAINHSHNITFRGGGEKTSYLGSVTYKSIQGIMKTTEKNFLTTRLNVNHSAINDRLKLSLNIQNTLTKGGMWWSNAYNQAVKQNPTAPIYDENGKINEIAQWDTYNPVGILEQRDEERKNNEYLVNLKADFEIISGLKVGTLLAYQKKDGSHGFNDFVDMYVSRVNGQHGRAVRWSDWAEDRTVEYTAEYNKEVAKNHRLNAIVGYSYQDSMAEGLWADNYNFLNDDFLWNNIESGDFLQDGRAAMTSYKNDSKLIAFFGRVNYNYAGRYMISASLRREGSSKFGANHKWGNFPAVSAGWMMSEEAFMDGTRDVISSLKIRAGYGVTGSVPNGNYMSLSRLKDDAPRMLYNGQWIRGVQPASNPNPDLKWEKKGELNVGVDFGLFNDRLTGSIEYYNRKTTDLLYWYSVPVPPNLYNQTYTNVGSLRNQGLEITLNPVIIRDKDLYWDANVNFSYNTNKLLTLSDGVYTRDYTNEGWLGAPGVNTYTHRLEPGKPIGNFYGLVFDRFDENGKWVFKDFNGVEGDNAEADKRVIGNGIPKYYANLSTSVSYRNFDLSLMLRGAFGFELVNMMRLYHENKTLFPLNVFKSALDSPLYDDPKYSDYYVENGSYVKIDNVTLGYSFSIPKLALTKARVYVSGLNLYTFTGFSGIDPELDVTGMTPGFEWQNKYPKKRSFNVGVQLTF
ncbi:MULTISPECIES: TonB-dependent receptor [unclassified Parabacteroides]|uniref:SusC/RagA family TonB-linked outer membrane protein n=1 Tax=unclassified Parabacteroides TaxID=2649774 RepID=UPI002476A461|nr:MULTISPECIES: TonB-dependent receptor [unclassified Parabacteroides]